MYDHARLANNREAQQFRGVQTKAKILTSRYTFLLTPQKSDYRDKMASCKVIASSYVMLVISILIVKVHGLVSDDVARDVAEVESQYRKLVEAFNSRDLEAYVSVFSKDCRIYLPGGQEIRGREGSYIYVRIRPSLVLFRVTARIYFEGTHQN